ncbi:MAG: hypothetical protein AseanaTS_17820 [Candidatus Pelagadaptatus aseana]|uniref:MarR family winged helix-turn-helix transcriptional regulator n=1 Tax=Candidatus Pelagadaptatus aseana TaxID=3120508 RepID=UPI0039B270FF
MMNYQNTLTFWLSRLGQLMQDDFNDILKDQLGEKSISWPQWLVLNHLGQQSGAMPAEIAAGIMVDRSAVTRLLDRLEEKKFVTRKREGLDRRVVNIYLTKLGEELLEKINIMALEHQARFLATIPSTEHRILKTDIQKMLKVLGIDTQQQWKVL